MTAHGTRRPVAGAALLTLALGAASCSVTQGSSTAGVRANGRGEPVIVAPVCGDQRIRAVQVADLDGPVRWRIEGGGSSFSQVVTVGRVPPLMRETDPLDGPLDPDRAYVAIVEYEGSASPVEVEFRPATLETDRIVTPDGETLTVTGFGEEADLACIGGWLWVFGGIAIAFGVGIVAALVLGLVVVVKVVRKARREREPGRMPAPGPDPALGRPPDRPDVSGR